MRLLICFALTFFCFSSLGSNAQMVTINGTIYNAQTKEPLAGATIKSGGKTLLSNSSGSYSIATTIGSTVEFSYVGLKSEVFTASQTEVRDIYLKPSNFEIDEVVISAYGSSLTRATNSGAIAVLDGNDLKKSHAPNFDIALKGKLPGVLVSTGSGLIADVAAVRIRGTNSVSLSSQPLIVIDGIPTIDAANLNTFNYGNGVRFNPLATISSNDIETVEVLKDASASALFGSRAGNGVILITTKKGRQGAASITYNGSYALSRASKLPNLLNANEFVEITNEKASAWFGQNTVLASDYFVDGKKVDTDWMKEAFRTAILQSHQISASGGNARSSYYAAAEWLQHEGIAFGTDYNRYAIRANATTNPNRWIKVGMSVSYSKTTYNGTLSEGYTPGITIAAYNAPPNTASYLNGSYNLTSDGMLGNGGNLYFYNNAKTFLNKFNHPLAVNSWNRNRNTVDRNMGYLFATISPFQSLSATTRIGVDNITNLEDQFNHPLLTGTGKDYNGYALVNNSLLQQWVWSNFVNYSVCPTLSSNLAVTCGFEYTLSKTQNILAGASNFASPAYQDILDNLYTTPYSGGNKSEKGFASYFGRATYSYKDKYHIDGSLRIDAYSGFGDSNQYGYFPGVSASWEVAKESFIQKVKAINELKLRASWGIVGNSSINPYASRTLYGQGQYADINGVSMRQVGNASLKWESNQKFNIGLDASLISRITLSFDWFYHDVNNMLFSAPAVLSSGIPGGGILTNIGKMSNRGLEVIISTENINRNSFSWTTTASFTSIKNRIKALAGSDILGTNSLVVGQPMGVWRLYQWAGVDPETGRAGYFDKDGKIKYYNPNPAIPAASRWSYSDGSSASALNNNDLKIENGKTGTPKWYGNIENKFCYRNFELAIGVQFAGGFYVLNNTKFGLLTNYLNNNVKDILNRWTTSGQNTDIPKLYWSDNISLQSASTRFLEKGDFIRLRDIEIAYALPKTLEEKLGVGARLFIRGENLAIITGYSGLDPEISSYRNTNYQAGWENRSVPMTRTFSIGATLKF